MWLKCYDQMLVANEGARLAGHHPLFTSLKNVGEPIAAMTCTLGRIVREAMASIGIPPDRYNAHSLRTFRATAVFDRGGSWPDVMVHDGRSLWSRRRPVCPPRHGWSAATQNQQLAPFEGAVRVSAFAGGLRAARCRGGSAIP